MAMFLFISCLIWMSIQSTVTCDKNIKLRTVEVHFVLSWVKMLSYTHPVYGSYGKSESEETTDETLMTSDVAFQNAITTIATEQPTRNAREQERKNRTRMTSSITIYSAITTITAEQEPVPNTTQQQPTNKTPMTSDVTFQSIATPTTDKQTVPNTTNKTVMTSYVTIQSIYTPTTGKQQTAPNTTEQQPTNKTVMTSEVTFQPAEMVTEQTEEQRAVTGQGLTEYTKEEEIEVTEQGLTEYTIEDGIEVTQQPSCNPSDCVCLCHSTDVKEKELEVVVKEIQKHLTVPKTNLSSRLRRKISASDPRTSSKIIGMTLGVCILTLTVSAIVISDFIRFLLYVCNRFVKDI